MKSRNIQDFIQSFHTLPKEILEELVSKLILLELPSNSYLLKKGDPCENVWFIVEGLIRHFSIDEKGRERNTWFTTGGTITTDIFSLINKVPSKESIQLLEDSIVYKLNYTVVTELLYKHHQFCIWHINIIEQFHFKQMDKRINELQFLDATERYDELISHNPHI